MNACNSGMQTPPGTCGEGHRSVCVLCAACNTLYPPPTEFDFFIIDVGIVGGLCGEKAAESAPRGSSFTGALLSLSARKLAARRIDRDHAGVPSSSVFPSSRWMDSTISDNAPAKSFSFDGCMITGAGTSHCGNEGVRLMAPR